MKVVYICSPCRAADEAGRERHRALALELCREVALRGDVPVAAHLLLPQFLDDGDPAEREVGLRCGGVLLARSDEVLVAGEISEGMARELRDAERMGIPVRRRR